MISCGVAAHGRPVCFVMVMFSCFQKNLTFANESVYSLMTVFITRGSLTAPSCVLSFWSQLAMKLCMGGFVIQRTSIYGKQNRTSFSKSVPVTERASGGTTRTSVSVVHAKV